RQQGCSTYIGARFYHKATHARGQQVFILTHEQSATENLFDMANRFHEYCPDLVRPHTGAANAKELVFDLLDSGYRTNRVRDRMMSIDSPPTNGAALTTAKRRVRDGHHGG